MTIISWNNMSKTSIVTSTNPFRGSDSVKVGDLGPVKCNRNTKGTYNISIPYIQNGGTIAYRCCILKTAPEAATMMRTIFTMTDQDVYCESPMLVSAADDLSGACKRRIAKMLLLPDLKIVNDMAEIAEGLIRVPRKSVASAAVHDKQTTRVQRRFDELKDQLDDLQREICKFLETYE